MIPPLQLYPWLLTQLGNYTYKTSIILQNYYIPHSILSFQDFIKLNPKSSCIILIHNQKTIIDIFFP